MRRREFLKWQLGALAWCAGTSAGLTFPGAIGKAKAADIPDIAVARGDPGAATRLAVDMLGGIGRFVKAGHKVVIKPNMSFAQGPESATNTHPLVVRELVALCGEAGAGSVRVLDNPLQNAARSMERSGIRAACDSVLPGICHHVTHEALYQRTAFTDGLEMRENAVMIDVLEADVIIAAPVAKSHGGAGVSLSLKGQMGLIRDRHSMHSRYDLHTSIVDLNTLLKPHLAVIDATRVLATNGPGGPGEVLTPGEVIASADPVAADALAVASYKWYGRAIEPRQVGYIQRAHERGLGRMDLENLSIGRKTV